MIANVPYFKNMKFQAIQELIFLLKNYRYDKNDFIIKKGDSTDRIFFVKSGFVDVEIPLRYSDKKQDKIVFDTLNPGSCFCIYSAFHIDHK